MSKVQLNHAFAKHNHELNSAYTLNLWFEVCKFVLKFVSYC